MKKLTNGKQNKFGENGGEEGVRDGDSKLALLFLVFVRFPPRHLLRWKIVLLL